MRRVDNIKRDTLDYTEYYWWHKELRTAQDFKALMEKDQPYKENK